MRALDFFLVARQTYQILFLFVIDTLKNFSIFFKKRSTLLAGKALRSNEIG